MQSDFAELSPTAVLAVARDVLSKNGFEVSNASEFKTSMTDRSFLAEDDYSVIAILLYDTTAELIADWTYAQSELVNLLTRKLAKSAPKAWDAYLVLLSTISTSDRRALTEIEQDTSRVRKIVATGESLRTTADVSRILDPLLPLTFPPLESDIADALAALPELLKNDIPIVATQTVVDAFRRLEPPLDRLHELGVTR